MGGLRLEEDAWTTACDFTVAFTIPAQRRFHLLSTFRGDQWTSSNARADPHGLAGQRSDDATTGRIIAGLAGDDAKALWGAAKRLHTHQRICSGCITRLRPAQADVLL